MDRRSLVALFLVAISIPFFACFGEALIRSDRLAHRDVSRFYDPLFQWTAGEWEAGRVPLWNPQENCGASVVGDTTSSVWYPGQLLFLLPFSDSFNFKLYVALHVLAAAGFTFRLARDWKASGPAATIAAVAYAFSGYVLFQYSNVVFLVGAAWLPVSVGAVDRMLRHRHPAWAVVLGMTLALMTLGGDPHTAYHVGLLAGLFSVLMWWKRRRRGSRSRAGRAAIRRHLTLLTLAAVVGGLLAAVQILPSMESSSRSERAAFYEPRSLYQIPAILAGGPSEPGARPNEASAGSRIARGIFGSPAPATHHRNLYRYSIAPWHLVQLIVPNAAGKPFPMNRRVLPPNEDGDTWVPSLYLGLLPICLALSVWSLRSRSIRIRWLSWAVGLAILAGLGWYGPGWLIRMGLGSAGLGGAGLGGAGEDGAGGAFPGEPVGGLYWLMVVALPGYDQFRYPAKWFLVVSLGLSLLSAYGWDRMAADSRRLARLLGGLGIALSLGLIGALAARTWLASWLVTFPPDLLYGPIWVEGSLRVLYLALLQGVIVCGAGWWLVRRAGGSRPRTIGLALILLTSAELAVAQAWMVTTASGEIWQAAPWAAREIAAHQRGSDGLFRVHRSRSGLFQNRHWLQTRSPRREAEALDWHRDTLQPRLYLETDLALLEAGTSVTPDDFQAVLGIARQFGPPRPGGIPQPHPHVLDALGVAYIVQDADPDVAAQEAELGRAPVAAMPERNVTLWYNSRAFPRAWIVHQVEWLPEIGTRDAALVDALTAHVFFPRGQVRDLSRTAAAEWDSPPDPRSMRPTGPIPSQDACRIEKYEPQRVEIAAQLARPGLVVLSDYYDTNWKAEVVNEASGERLPARVVRANRIMRGLFLPPGRYHITYRYQPRLLWFGAMLSGIGWMGLGAWFGIRRVGRSKPG